MVGETEGARRATGVIPHPQFSIYIGNIPLGVQGEGARRTLA
jgi:hypothetical protein